MQKLITTIVLSIVLVQAQAQSNFEKFKQLLQQNDSGGIKELLATWEKKVPADPEFYTSAFNFYFGDSRKEVVALQKEQPNGESLQLMDSTGNAVAFLGSEIGYDPDKLKRAFSYIDAGIEKFPDRLDMRFGKCYALGMVQDYYNFTKSILETVEYSAVNHNKWLWTENQKRDDGESLLLSSVQGYLVQLYDTEDDSLLPDMMQIGNATLKHYPDNVEILSSTSVALLLTKDYDKAIEHLKHAETIRPKDCIVLNNIAHAYKMKSDKINAVRYYELIEKYGNEQEKKLAQESIKELNK